MVAILIGLVLPGLAVALYCGVALSMLVLVVRELRLRPRGTPHRRTLGAAGPISRDAAAA